MSKISRRGLRITATAAGTAVVAVAALAGQPARAGTAHAGPGDAGASTIKGSLVTTRVRLAPMPQGTVTIGRNRDGEVDVTVNAFGLTPGSSHTVELLNGSGQIVTRFSPLTANAKGQAQDARLDSSYPGTFESAQVAILNGNGVTPVTLLTIARTGNDASRRTYQLIPVETDQDGRDWGTPQGSAVVSYDPNARTISVTVNGGGFTPGAHAAHIHLGSCQSQGAVQYMLMDFTANGNGQVVDETRTIMNVTTPLPASGWYLNLHQGDSNNILSNGNPTINFRPLLCGNIVTPR